MAKQQVVTNQLVVLQEFYWRAVSPNHLLSHIVVMPVCVDLLVMLHSITFVTLFPLLSPALLCCNEDIEGLIYHAYPRSNRQQTTLVGNAAVFQSNGYGTAVDRASPCHYAYRHDLSGTWYCCTSMAQQTTDNSPVGGSC